MKKKIWTGIMGIVYVFAGFSSATYLTKMSDQMMTAYGPNWVRTSILAFWGVCAIILGLILGVNYVAAALTDNSSKDGEQPGK